ncbi:SoxR reducing system RseC family protein [Thermospira aquatica]|uniref:SoxR reducing system RseC family protein n=1 Tax=Thermospira aquatica TaxID=2828656 RepID=A0AAX3BBA2_9SPIR|nr:SoxR reducing system RseC family protein [Thermospira aquatica]URA09309.1 SoxR reducing system RseC family protein [Thermospira aquatica]
MKELGKIRQCYPDHIVVDILEHAASSCNQCSLHGHCHIETGERTLTIWTKNTWKVGEEVWVEVRESVLIEIATLLFLLPSLLLIGGSALLHQWMPTPWAVLVSLSVIGMYFCILRCLSPRILRRFRIIPKESVAEVFDDISHYTRYPENITM